MRKTKHVFPAFSFYDRTGIQNYLEKQAQKGWLLEKMGLMWKFRRIEPKRIHFAVTYFPKASAFDPVPSDQELMFREFCAHSGWNLAASSAQLQIFYNEQEDPVPIETDPKMELENLHKTAKKIYLPAYYMLLPVGILPWMTISMAWRNDPLSFLSSNIYFFNILTSIICLLLASTELLGYYRWRAKAVRAAEDGEFLQTRGRRYFQIFLVGLMFLCLMVLMFDASDLHISAMMIAVIGLICLAVALSVSAMKLMKRMKFSAKKNQIITFVIIAVTSVAAVGMGTIGVISLMDTWENTAPSLPTYEFLNRTRTLQQDDIPLKIQDITEADPSIYSYEWTYESESLLLARRTAYQRPRLDMLDQPDLTYTIVEVKADFLYDFCLRQMLKDIECRSYNWCDPEPWGADEVYGAFADVGHYDMYILCYGNRLIALETDWELTDEQKGIVGAIFG